MVFNNFNHLSALSILALGLRSSPPHRPRYVLLRQYIVWPMVIGQKHIELCIFLSVLSIIFFRILLNLHFVSFIIFLGGEGAHSPYFLLTRFLCLLLLLF